MNNRSEEEARRVNRPLQVLLVEDSQADAELVLLELRRGGYEPMAQRVDTARTMQEALDRQRWDLVIADHVMPGFSSKEALALVKKKNLDLPFIIVSGHIRQDEAAAVMAAGAHDYVMKDRLARLGPAVKRELREGEVREARKLSEEALRESEERFRFIVESATDYAIFTLDMNGLITSWNLGAQWILGYGEHEIIGQNGRIFFLPEDRKKRVPEIEMKKALSEGRAGNDRWHIRKDGSLFWASGCMMTFRDEEGSVRGFLVILRDMTEAKRAEETIKNALAEAEASTRAKDQFLAMLSHELRTPLTPISMAVSIMQTDHKLPKRWAATLEMIQRNLKLEAHLIDDLLDLSRIIHKKVELKVATIDLHQCIQRAVEICQCDIKAKDQRITVELEAERHHVRGDSARLQQVFWNLIKNAVKFTPDAGSLTIRSANIDEKIRVAVSDTGMGIEQAMLPKIFDAFEQGDQAVVQQYGGLGLGLAISKATIDAHTGKLTAASCGRGQGAVFTVEIPTVVAESAKAVNRCSTSKPGSPTKAGRSPKPFKGPFGSRVPDGSRMEGQ